MSTVSSSSLLHTINIRNHGERPSEIINTKDVINPNSFSFLLVSVPQSGHQVSGIGLRQLQASKSPFKISKFFWNVEISMFFGVKPWSFKEIPFDFGRFFAGSLVHHQYEPRINHEASWVTEFVRQTDLKVYSHRTTSRKIMENCEFIYCHLIPLGQNKYGLCTIDMNNPAPFFLLNKDVHTCHDWANACRVSL